MVRFRFKDYILGNECELGADSFYEGSGDAVYTCPFENINYLTVEFEMPNDSGVEEEFIIQNIAAYANEEHGSKVTEY